MTVLATFRSDMRAVARVLKRIFLWGTAAAAIAVLVIRIPQDQLPIPQDLFLLALPAIACFFGGLLFLVLTRLFPVQILSTGLRCYDTRSRYHIVRWSDITNVQLQHVYTLPYLYIKASGVSHAVTLPLWLEGMSDFVSLAERQGGRDNILVAALRAAT